MLVLKPAHEQLHGPSRNALPQREPRLEVCEALVSQERTIFVTLSRLCSDFVPLSGHRRPSTRAREQVRATPNLFLTLLTLLLTLLTGAV